MSMTKVECVAAISRRLRVASRGHRRLAAPELAGQRGDRAAEGGPAEDVLVDQARHLVLLAPHATLGPLEGEVGLVGHEVGQPLGGREVAFGGAAPALAQLRHPRRLARHDPAALGMPAQHPVLAQPSRIAGVAEGQQVPQPDRAHAVDERRAPDDAKGRQERVVGAGQGGVEAGVEPPRTAPARRRDRHGVVVRRIGARRPLLLDPREQQPALQRAGRVQEEDHPRGRAAIGLLRPGGLLHFRA